MVDFQYECNLDVFRWQQDTSRWAWEFEDPWGEKLGKVTEPVEETGLQNMVEGLALG